MKKGYTMLNTILALLLSFMILDLLWTTFQQMKRIDTKNYNQDILSALQVYALFNQASNIRVNDKIIHFELGNEDRTLRYVNQKLVMSPGTVIYWLDVTDYQFYVFEEKIYLQIKRKQQWHDYLIGNL